MKKGGALALIAVIALSLFVVLFVTTGVREETTDCVPGRPGASSAAGGVPAGSFAKPMKTSEAQLTSPFGQRWGTMHNGIDLAGPLGTPIYAYADGIVSKAGDASGFGQWIVIDHNIDGQVVSTVYGHMFPDGVLVHAGNASPARQVHRVDARVMRVGHRHPREDKRCEVRGGADRSIEETERFVTACIHAVRGIHSSSGSGRYCGAHELRTVGTSN